MEKNALVLVVSLYSDGRNEISYSFGGDIYSGRQTNEAAAKLTIDKYGADRLICISSPQVLNDKKNDLGGKTTYEHLTETLSSYALEKGKPVPEFVCIPTHDGDVAKPTSQLFDELIGSLDGCTITYDTTGGGRDTSMLLRLLMKYLETTGRQFKKAWYSDINMNTENDSRIVDVTEEVDPVLDLLDAVGTFRTTGSSKALVGLKGKSIVNADLCETIDKMERFSSAIRLNRVGGLEKIITDMNVCFDKIICSGSVDGSSAEYLFRALMPHLKESFFPDGKADLIGIVRWCLKNDLLQQAMTMITERLPAYLFSEKRIEFHGDKAAVLKNKQPHEDDKYYLYFTVLLKNPGTEKKRLDALREGFYKSYREGRLTDEKIGRAHG